MFEKNLKIGYLLDFYGEALPRRTHDVLDGYYGEDLSLGEIAEAMGISRQGVRHIVEFYGEGALLASSIVLVKNTAANSLVDLLGSKLVCCHRLFLITGSQRCVVLFDQGTHLGLEDLILKGLRLRDLHALLCGFNVRQNIHLLCFFEAGHLRGCVLRVSYTKVF